MTASAHPLICPLTKPRARGEPNTDVPYAITVTTTRDAGESACSTYPTRLVASDVRTGQLQVLHTRPSWFGSGPFDVEAQIS